MNPKQFRNPFYVLLLIVGIVFLITACGYAVMAARGIDPTTSAATSSSGEWLMDFMDLHGSTLMIVELGLLGVTAFAAMATDQYWMQRQTTQEEPAIDSSEEGMQ